MRRFSKLAAVFVVLGTVSVFAQTPDPAPAPAAAPAVATAAQLTVAEMSERSITINAEMKDHHRAVLALKEKATQQKDVIKLTCINDKLVEMKAQMNIADQANASLQAALTDNRPEAQTSFKNLEDAGTAVSKLRDSAITCMGEPELYKQESGLEVDRPEIPDDPGTIDPYDPGLGGGGVVLDPPGYASPFN